MDEDQNNKDSSITVEQLLEYPEVGEKKKIGIVIKGGPGSGKSTLLDKIAYTWAKNVNGKTNTASYEYIFRINLKKLETAKAKKG